MRRQLSKSPLGIVSLINPDCFKETNYQRIAPKEKSFRLTKGLLFHKKNQLKKHCHFKMTYFIKSKPHKQNYLLRGGKRDSSKSLG